MSPRIEIRRAEIQDVTKLVRLGEMFHTEAEAAAYIPLDQESLAQSFRMQIRASNASILVITKHDEIVGAAGLGMARNFFNKNVLVGIEQFFWVTPEHRGGLGLKLIRGLEAEARELKCTHLIMISLEAVKPLATGRFYERLGYKCLEHSYIRKL
jgi:GNAT superfamily N-acetyltransferase